MIAQYSYLQVTGVCQLVAFIALAAAAGLVIGGAVSSMGCKRGKLTAGLYIGAILVGLLGAGCLLIVSALQKLPVTNPVNLDAFARTSAPWIKGTDGTQVLTWINWPAITGVAGAIGLVALIDLVAVAILWLVSIPIRRAKSTGLKVVFASLISIVIGLIVGSIITLVSGLSSENITPQNTVDAVKLIGIGLFSTGRDATGALTFGFNPQLMGNMLFRAMPLIMTGLSVALAQKTGLFNIGAPGQYLMGTAATLLIALYLPTGTGEKLQYVSGEWATHMEALGMVGQATWPSWLVWTLAFLGGVLAGAIWGAIPGLLKAALNINEVLACIMTNWIAANLVTWIFDAASLKNTVENTKMGYIYKTTFNGVQTSKFGLDHLLPGSQVSGGILVACLLAVVVYILLSKTTFGYELKACGSNRFAARYAGIRDKRSIVVSMALAGALAGAGAALYYLAGNTEFYWETSQSLPAVGFNGIPVALLAANNPIGVIFSGLFMSMLEICGQKLKDLTAFNEYITDVIIAVIVYLSAFAMLIRMLLNKKTKKEALK